MGHAQLRKIMSLLIYIAFALVSTIRASTYSGKSEIKSANDDIDIINEPQYLPSDLNGPENVNDDFLDSLKDDDEKRRIDRMMFHSSLGKRDVGNDESGVAKRGSIDSFGFSGMLGKRGGLDRYGFVGSLGKRGGFDRYGFIGNLGKRRGYDRYGFIGALGKRRGMDRYSFVGALGKRGRIDSYGFADMLGKRDPHYNDQELDEDKRSKLDRYSFFRKFGKRMDFTEDDLGKEIDKRSIDTEQSEKPKTRRKRSTAYPWFLDRQQRYYPSKWLRGIDRFSFGTRLGKRAPNWRFFPQVGKIDDLTPYDLGMYSLKF